MQFYIPLILLLFSVLSPSCAEKTVSHGLPRLPHFRSPYRPPHPSLGHYPAPHPSYKAPLGYAPYMPPRIHINQLSPSVHKSHDPNAINDRYVSPLRPGQDYTKSAPSVVTFRSSGRSPSDKIIGVLPHDKHSSNSTPEIPLHPHPAVHETIPIVNHPEHKQSENHEDTVSCKRLWLSIKVVYFRKTTILDMQ